MNKGIYQTLMIDMMKKEKYDNSFHKAWNSYLYLYQEKNIILKIILIIHVIEFCLSSKED